MRFGALRPPVTGWPFFIILKQTSKFKILTLKKMPFDIINLNLIIVWFSGLKHLQRV